MTTPQRISLDGIKPVFKTVSVRTEAPAAAQKQKLIPLDSVSESTVRPKRLDGSTYKIKPPSAEHALYLTINHYVLNAGTEHETKVPFEIFLNSKDTQHFQWIVIFTRLASAVFRKGGDIKFLIEEMQSVFDPNGGFFSPERHKFVPSLIAEIGNVIQEHFEYLGVIALQKFEPSTEQLAMVDARLAEEKGVNPSFNLETASKSDCKACGGKDTVVMLSGCPTCTSCADSKCG